MIQIDYKDLYKFICELKCQDELDASEEHIKLAFWYTRSDGCTGTIDLFKEACIIHDFHYRTHHDLTGRIIDRAEADRRFLKRIQKLSQPKLRWLPIEVKKMIVVVAFAAIIGYCSPIAWWRWSLVRTFGGQFWEDKTNCRV